MSIPTVLPRRAPAADGVAAGAAKALPSSQPLLTVLVAEDDEDNRLLLKTWLEMRFYRVVEADDGREALRVAQSERPALILLDLQLPLLNGFAVARGVRQDQALRDVPIVIITAHDPAKHRAPALAAGCQDYLTKPIDFRRMGALLENLLSAAAAPLAP